MHSQNPTLEIQYTDKKKLEILTTKLPASEIYDDVYRHVKKLKLDWDIKQSI